MKIRIVGVVVGVLLLCNNAHAQLSRKKSHHNERRMATFQGVRRSFSDKAYNSFGFSINGLNYFGDLAPLSRKASTDISFTRPGFAFSWIRRMGPRYSLQTQFMWGTLSASDQSADPGDEAGHYRHLRNLSFRNQIKELSVIGYFDLFRNQATYMRRVRWTPYVYGGLAVFLHNPQAMAPMTYLDGSPNPSGGNWVNLHDLGTEGQYAKLSSADVNYGIKPYSLVQVALPVGAGVRFRVNDLVDIWADIGFRYTFTDYLDDVSQNYVDLGKLTSPLAQAMSYRTNELFNGNPPGGISSSLPGVSTLPGFGSEHHDNMRGFKGAKDMYMVTNIKITYIFGAHFYQGRLYTSRAVARAGTLISK
ncbi:MAG: hypothetical protein K1X47_01390 [Cyclobacteriaceae bacterium]|nr:hypothetical protein [Cyclobacteriaceae bacterium]